MRKRFATLNLAALMLVVASGALFGAFAQNGAISGKITSSAEGTPVVAGAVVTATMTAGSVTTIITGTSDPGGSYDLGNELPLGNYSIKVTAAGFVDYTHAQPIALTEGEPEKKDLNITLNPIPTYTISGTVRVDNGAAQVVVPIANAVVKLMRGNDSLGVATSGENGAFSFAAGVLAGTYTVNVTAVGFAPGSANVTVTNANITGLSVALKAYYTVSGAITDNDGEPIAGAAVELLDGDEEVVASAASDADGEYEIADVVSGQYGVKVVKAGFQTADTSLTVAGANVTGFDITLSPPVPALTVTAPASIVYGETLGAVTFECENCPTNPAVTFSYSGTLAIADSSYGPTATAPAIPGSFVITAKLVLVEGDDDIEEVAITDTASFNISRKTLAWTEGAVFNKVYDGTTAAVVDSTKPAPTLDGIFQADSVFVQTAPDTLTRGVVLTVTSGTAAFDAPNAGNGIAVTASGFSAGLGGPNAWKYMVPRDTANNVVQPGFAAANITKATVEGVDQTMFVLADTARSYSFALTRLLPSIGSMEFGDLTYEIVSVANADGVLDSVPAGVVESPLTLNVAKAEDGDSAVVTIRVSSGNFANFTAVLTLAVVDKDPVTIVAAMEGGVFNGAPFAYNNLVITNADGDTLDITPDVLYVSTDGGGYSSASAPVNAGAYRLTLSVSVNNADYIGSETFMFAIAKKVITLIADDITLDVGSPKPAAGDLTYTLSDDLAGDDELTTEPTLSLSPTANMNSPGVYAINISGAAASPNYDLKYAAGILTVKDTIDVSIKESDRGVTVVVVEEEVAVVTPVRPLASEFAAGPNPVSRTGAVTFFRTGGRVENGALTVYGANGSVVARISVSDRSAGVEKRQIAAWNLRDVRGRAVSEGTYLVRGSLRTADGRRENVSLMIGVR